MALWREQKPFLVSSIRSLLGLVSRGSRFPLPTEELATDNSWLIIAEDGSFAMHRPETLLGWWGYRGALTSRCAGSAPRPDGADQSRELDVRTRHSGMLALYVTIVSR